MQSHRYKKLFYNKYFSKINKHPVYFGRMTRKQNIYFNIYYNYKLYFMINSG